MKATYRRYAQIFETENHVQLRPGLFNPNVITTKEAHVIYGNMNNETASSACCVGEL